MKDLERSYEVVAMLYKYIPLHFAVIAEGRQVPSAVNLKQCSKRNLHDSREYGVLLVSTFVILKQ